jgi:hypothetical protein
VDQGDAHIDPVGDSNNFGARIILAQERCTVSTECTTGMEITLGTPIGTPL